MNQEQVGEILRANVKNLSEPLKSAVEFTLTNFFAPSAADLAKKFLASLPSMTTEDAELKSRIDAAYFTLMNDEKIWLSLENLPHEVWKQISGYEKLYEISNYGRVKSFQNGKLMILKAIPLNGYFVVNLYKNKIKRQFLVHVLVAKAFIPNPNGKPYVNHLDGNKMNNCLSNLEWATIAENVRHAYKLGLIKQKSGCEHQDAKLTEEQVRYVRKVCIPGDSQFGFRALARIFNLTDITIANLYYGKTYKNVT